MSVTVMPTTARDGREREGGPVPDGRGTGDAPVSEHERAAWSAGRSVIGIDEVGRGALAGPVTVAAVLLDPDRPPAGARDSKRLSPARREQVARTVRSTSLVGIGAAGNDEIDAVGLAAALTEAARRALAAVMAMPDAPVDPLVLIDGPHDLVRLAGVDVATLVRGDSRSISIAAASVVAKVDRDALMLAAEEQHPGYGFGQNRGYASPEHLEALRRDGPCALHRHTWSPIAQMLQPAFDV
jgi:ribonuclease HII